MSEEERLKIAKERIEYIFKTYMVYVDYNDDEGFIIMCAESLKRIELDCNV